MATRLMRFARVSGWNSRRPKARRPVTVSSLRTSSCAKLHILFVTNQDRFSLQTTVQTGNVYPFVRKITAVFQDSTAEGASAQNRQHESPTLGTRARYESQPRDVRDRSAQSTTVVSLIYCTAYTVRIPFPCECGQQRSFEKIHKTCSLTGLAVKSCFSTTKFLCGPCVLQKTRDERMLLFGPESGCRKSTFKQVCERWPCSSCALSDRNWE